MAYTNRYFIFGEIVLTFKGLAPDDIREFFEVPLDEPIETDSETALAKQDNKQERTNHHLLNIFNEFFREAKAKNYLNFTNNEEEVEHQHLFIQTDLSDRELLSAVIRINEFINNKEYETGNLEAVAPNWLMVASDPEQSGFGGPGTYPVKVDDATGDTEYCFNFYTGYKSNGKPKWSDFFEKYKKDKKDKSEEMKKSKSVVVAVLDTYPKDAQISAFKITNDFLGRMTNMVNVSLVEVDDKVNVILNTLKKNQDDNKGIHAKAHEYEMSSHGLFVTSLIHMIAPKAKIKVYRVLNDYGIGTSYTVMRGLQEALSNHQEINNHEDIPLVINLSLTMTFPLLKDHLPTETDKPIDFHDLLELIIDDIEEERGGADVWGYKCGMDQLACQLRYAVQSVTHLLSKLKNVTIVAAAGNENVGNGVPEASFPASFEEVIGVAALKALDKPPTNESQLTVSLTTYSSKADKPARQGFAVFGGESAEPPEKKQAKKATFTGVGRLAGLYIDKFPESNGDGTYKPPENNNNSTGWAYWSGTSFATPIIAGAMAKLLLINGKSEPDKILEKYWNEDDGFYEGVPHIVLAMQGTKDADGNCKSNVEPSNDGEGNAEVDE